MEGADGQEEAGIAVHGTMAHHRHVGVGRGLLQRGGPGVHRVRGQRHRALPEQDGRSGEVYFNYNLGKRQGELSEKDAEYADDLVAVFASALRDGPRPERTPESDPNLSRSGPAIGRPRKLLPRLAARYSFSPEGRFSVYQDGSTIFALPTDQPDGKPFEVVRLDHSPWDVHVLNEDLDCLVQEGAPHAFTTNDELPERQLLHAGI